MKLLKRHRCSLCNQMAQYKSADGLYRSFYYCRDCKPKEGEFMFERNGFPICLGEKVFNIPYTTLIQVLFKHSSKLSIATFVDIQKDLKKCFFNNTNVDESCVDYKKFMAEFGERINIKILTKEYKADTPLLRKFYVNFKKELQEKKKNVKFA